MDLVRGPPTRPPRRSETRAQALTAFASVTLIRELRGPELLPALNEGALTVVRCLRPAARDPLDSIDQAKLCRSPSGPPRARRRPWSRRPADESSVRRRFRALLSGCIRGRDESDCESGMRRSFSIRARETRRGSAAARAETRETCVAEFSPSAFPRPRDNREEWR